ncbi:hypothetical protein [Microbacterium sp. NPDC056052]|uniref:hypothetical protein n=1 Tax=Microbacterium sp. NPDC056052 TaxID=3345695 RepID=UPI0035D7E354
MTTHGTPMDKDGALRSDRGWTRRRAVAAGVWSVPVIAAALALPQASASVAITVDLLGAVDDAQTYPFSVAGDTAPLIFQVAGAGPIPADGTAELVNAVGIASWDESVLLQGALASAPIDTDGTLILPIVALAAGTFPVLVHVGPVSRTFMITLVPA